MLSVTVQAPVIATYTEDIFSILDTFQRYALQPTDVWLDMTYFPTITTFYHTAESTTDKRANVMNQPTNAPTNFAKNPD